MDGLWTAEFGSNAGVFGGGTVVFQGDKIMGGDATYYYVGHYSLKGNMFRAVLKVSPFIEGAESVFKTVGKNIVLNLEGTVLDDSHIVAQGSAEGMPRFNFGAKLTKRV